MCPSWNMWNVRLCSANKRKCKTLDGLCAHVRFHGKCFNLISFQVTGTCIHCTYVECMTHMFTSVMGRAELFNPLHYGWRRQLWLLSSTYVNEPVEEIFKMSANQQGLVENVLAINMIYPEYHFASIHHCGKTNISFAIMILRPSLTTEKSKKSKPKLWQRTNNMQYC